MPHRFRTLMLATALLLPIGIARADYQTYDEALVTARALFEKGDYEAAQKELEAGLPLAKTTDEKVSAYTRLGETYNRRKLYPQARAEWEKILQFPSVLGDDQAGIRLLIATTYSAEKNWEQASKELQQALDTPDIGVDSKFSFRLALFAAYANSDQPELWSGAQEQIYAILDDPQTEIGQKAKAAILLGDVSAGKGKFEEARTAYGEVDNINGVPTPLRLQAMLKVAESYLKEKKTAEASTVYEKAFRYGFDEGAKLFEGDKFEESIAVLKLCLDIPRLPTPLKSGPLYYIGASLMELKEGVKAATVLRMASIEPTAAELAKTGPLDTRSFRSFQTSARVRVIRLYAGSPNKENQAVAVTLINELLQDPNADLNDNRRAQLRQTLKSLPQPTP